MLSDAEAFLDKLVADGVLTQDEADEKLAHLMKMMER